MLIDHNQRKRPYAIYVPTSHQRENGLKKKENQGISAKNKDILNMYDVKIWVITAGANEANWPKKPRNMDKKPKNMAQGTTGKTRRFAGRESREKEPKAHKIRGKTKIWADRVVEMTSFNHPHTSCLSKKPSILGAKTTIPKVAIKES